MGCKLVLRNCSAPLARAPALPRAGGAGRGPSAAGHGQEVYSASCKPILLLASSPRAPVTLSLSLHVLQPFCWLGWRVPRGQFPMMQPPYLMVLSQFPSFPLSHGPKFPASSPPHQPIPAPCLQHWESPACAAGGITTAKKLEKSFPQKKKDRTDHLHFPPAAQESFARA